jgi:hypothetical protein
MKIPLITILIAAAAMLFSTDVRADHTNTNGTNVITCDLSDLEEILDDVEVSDIKAPNDNARRGRLNSLLNALDAALEAADEGDVETLKDALTHIAKKANGRKNAWISGDLADDITDAVEELLDCVETFDHDDDDDDDD